MPKYAFISYVRENAQEVDRLCERLTASGATLWLDRAKIRPGAHWKDAIRSAITDGAYFVACFSQESVARERSYMNEELSLAIDELRLRPTDRTWFIPLKLNNCVIPDRAIGGGQQLADIHHVDLSNDWNAGIELLLQVLVPLDQRLTGLYSAASAALSHQIRHLGGRKKTDKFTVGFTGNYGVGISDLLRNVKGYQERVTYGLPVALDGIEEHRIEGVGRVLDIRTTNATSSREALERQVDLVVFVVGVSSRIHARDIEAIKALPEALPSLIVISKWDLADEPRDTRLCETIAQQTDRPVVLYSREYARCWSLVHQMLLELAALYEGPASRLWRLFVPRNRSD